MFQLTRIKLTTWYLLIIMFVSILFSIAIYAGINREFTRFERLDKLRTERIIRQPRFDHAEFSASRNRLILNLIFINIAILIISGGAGYFLAGRTLRPIKKMVDEQNRFITDASHELKTPITALRSEIEVNLRNKNLTLEKAKNLLKSNLEETINLQVLSDSLLQLTQSQTKIKDFKTVPLYLIVENAKKKIMSLAKEKNITIDTHLGKESVWGDEISLSQLFLILFDNAVKYSPHNTKITVTTENFGERLKIDISDEGVGIDKEDLPHIFERFYRVDKARSKKIEGYGLGLAIAKKIVQEHNGLITVTNNKNKGTTFVVKLPASKKRKLAFS